MKKMKLTRIFAKNRLLSGRKPLWPWALPVLWAAALLLPALAAPAQVVFTNLYSFSTFPTSGAGLNNGLVQGSDSYFYGTTQYGGTNGGGTVFKISTNGVLTTLYSFTGGIDGGTPYAGLVQGSDSYFYGTTQSGGTNGYGTVFQISSNGALTSLYSFSGNDGAHPEAGLVQGSDSYFYGTTQNGGTNGYGTVFKISNNGVLTTLYSFTGDNYGYQVYPYARLVQGTDGYFYGTTESVGGPNYAGTVFKISSNGVLTTLYSFTGGNDGANPLAALVQGSDGFFYGTTQYGGGTNNAGTVFKISSNGILTTLHSFTGANDGANPYAALVLGNDGYFYGTTVWGGTNGYGTVFKMATNGASVTLHSFTGRNDSAGPNGLVQGSGGYFYGMTVNGTSTVFKISTNGVLTTLYSFTGGIDGGTPYAGLVQGSDSYFYGTTQSGGTNGGGTVFKISSNGALTSLYSFTGTYDGALPVAGLVQGTDGNFYGRTLWGGTNGFGTVFKISTNGAFTSLYSFGSVQDTNGDLLDGSLPSGLVQGNDGFFYGTTSQGGTNSDGTVFKIGTNGALTSLYSFGAVKDTNGYLLLDGSGPSGLVQGSDGYFYGTTYGGGTNNAGTVFKISTNGVLTSLYSFTGTYDGGSPSAALMQGSDGYFYGTTPAILRGGFNPPLSYGALFKINTNGVLTTLHTFTGGNDGWDPSGALVQGSDGYFYGTTLWGGFGTVFKISSNGVLTSMYSFSGNDGENPYGLVQGTDGRFYGTTSQGGQGGAGSIFRLTIVPEFQSMTLTHGTLNLAWTTEAGGIYQLQASASLNTPNWTNLGSPVTATNGTLTFTDAVTNAPQRFYRVSLAP